MKSKITNYPLLIISLSFVVIGILIGVVTPSGYNVSPSVLYQQGVLHICSFFLP